MSSITGLISGGGGGGGFSSNISLDDFPFQMVQTSTIYQASTGNRDNDENMWNQFSSSMGQSNQVFWNYFTTTGWNTLINETGSGRLFWVMTPSTSQTTTIRITIDGVAREYSRNFSGISSRLLGGVDTTGVFTGSSTARSFYRSVDFRDTVYNLPNGETISSWSSTIGIGGNANGYERAGVPSIKFESSLKIEFNNNLAESSWNSVGACCRLKY